MNSLKAKKIVLITGCSSGIGFKTALTFARKNYVVIATMRNIKSNGAKLLKEIAEKEKLNITILEIDVTKVTTIEKAIKIIQKDYGRIDVLINNAGFGYLGPVEMFDIEEIKEQYETNVFGSLRMIKAVLPIMRGQKSGRIINISSINGIVAFPLWGVYSSSKFALESLTTSLRYEVSHFGIHVSLIEPGSFNSSFAINKKYPKTIKSKSNPYEKTTNAFFSRYEKAVKIKNSFIARLTDPQKVADIIFAVSQKENPKLHYKVGIDAKLFFFLEKVLPEATKEFILNKIFQW